jgi:hypothetical protein
MIEVDALAFAKRLQRETGVDCTVLGVDESFTLA